MDTWSLKTIHDREVEQRRKSAAYTFVLLAAAIIVTIAVAIAASLIGSTVH